MDNKIYHYSEEIINTLKSLGLALATMESCTSGSLVSYLTDVAGSSDVIKESLVTYSDQAKIKAGVSRRDIEEYTVYSPSVAVDMAKVMHERGNDIGVGVTGRLEAGDFYNVDVAIVYTSNLDTDSLKYEVFNISSEPNEIVLNSRRELKNIVCLEILSRLASVIQGLVSTEQSNNVVGFDEDVDQLTSKTRPQKCVLLLEKFMHPVPFITTSSLFKLAFGKDLIIEAVDKKELTTYLNSNTWVRDDLNSSTNFALVFVGFGSMHYAMQNDILKSNMGEAASLMVAFDEKLKDQYFDKFTCIAKKSSKLPKEMNCFFSNICGIPLSPLMETLASHYQDYEEFTQVCSEKVKVEKNKKVNLCEEIYKLCVANAHYNSRQEALSYLMSIAKEGIPNGTEGFSAEDFYKAIWSLMKDDMKKVIQDCEFIRPYCESAYYIIKDIAFVRSSKTINEITATGIKQILNDYPNIKALIVVDDYDKDDSYMFVFPGSNTEKSQYKHLVNYLLYSLRPVYNVDTETSKIYTLLETTYYSEEIISMIEEDFSWD